eukprot:evm.model.NODE_16421_length_6325_cov_27.414228.4
MHNGKIDDEDEDGTDQEDRSNISSVSNEFLSVVVIEGGGEGGREGGKEGGKEECEYVDVIIFSDKVDLG